MDDRSLSWLSDKDEGVSLETLVCKSESADRKQTTFVLPSSFDNPNADGWAGCSAMEAGQPEAVRVNLRQIIGQGANGTLVFALVINY
ncbi:unnamed protein product [Protopolystoma xenopodis]|uniref:Uncharacterized protein n=1 Tax=Protopolystoma xenopodis TaxID=117903 RepID=A0A3S5FDE3_9PLAT|nr:unnamed protein product [Protopolystoma xenopodis]